MIYRGHDITKFCDNEVLSNIFSESKIRDKRDDCGVLEQSSVITTQEDK